MALQKEITADQSEIGIVASEGYIKVNSVHASGTEVNMDLWYYHNKESRDANARPVLIVPIVTQISNLSGSGDIIAQAYTYAKTLDFLDGASDV